jgi:hypothetical protein
MSVNPKSRQTIWVPRTRRHKSANFFGIGITRNEIKHSKKRSLKSLHRYRGKRELDPDLMIFHIGRCGSTLLSEVLRLDRGNFVLSEPGPPSTWHKMKPGSQYSRQDKLELFRGTLRSYSAARLKYETRTIFKFSTYNNFYFKKYVEAFPACPRFFLHRHPNEVLMSYLKGAPSYVQGLYTFFSEEKKPKVQSGYLHYLVHHLRSLYEAVETQMDPDTVILNYDQLDLQGIKNIFLHLGYRWNPDVEKRVRHRMRYYSKPRRKGKLFKGDEAPADLKKLLSREKAMIEKNLMPFYERFEDRRLRSDSCR